MTTTKFTDPERLDLPSASSAQRRQACLGSPDTGSSPGNALADEGTLIHLANETGDYTDLTDEQAVIAERIKGLMDRAFQNWLTQIPEKDHKDVKEYKEARFWILKPGTLDRMESAKLDLCYVWGTKALIIDAKSGFKTAMPSPRNAQLRTQALALWSHIPELTEITVAIAQVRFKSNYNECVYSVDDMKMAHQQFLLVHWMRSQPDAPRNAGEWCTYCPALDDCKTAGAYSLLTPTTLALTPESSKEDVEARVNALTLPQLAKLHSYSTITIKTLEAVKERLKGVSEEDRNSVNLTMGKPAKVAEVTDIEGARDIFVGQNHLVTKKEFDAHVSLTLGKLEKIAVPRLAKRSDMSQKAAKEQLRDALQHCITFSEKAASLAPFVPESKQITE